MSHDIIATSGAKPTCEAPYSTAWGARPLCAPSATLPTKPVALPDRSIAAFGGTAASTPLSPRGPLCIRIERKQLLRARDAAQRVTPDRNEAASHVVDIGKRRGHQHRLVDRT